MAVRTVITWRYMENMTSFFSKNKNFTCNQKNSGISSHQALTNFSFSELLNVLRFSSQSLMENLLKFFRYILSFNFQKKKKKKNKKKKKKSHIFHIPPCYRRANCHVYDFSLKPQLKLYFFYFRT
jgi:hypothetical protein